MCKHVGKTVTKTIASLTVDSLIANGIDTLYCVPGVQNDHFFNALYDQTDKVFPLQTRHEQGAVYMALGAALATGKQQAFSLVPGPGFLNGSAALCTAYALNAPLFGVIGQIPSGAIGKHLGLLHEIEDQLGIMKTLGKHAERITDADTAASQLHHAWTELNSDCPAPVCVEIPVNVWQKSVDYDKQNLAASVSKPVVNTVLIARAAKLICQSKNPLIVVGSGAQDHASQIRDLASRIGAGVIAFRTGHGVMSSNDALCLNAPTGHRLWPDCDLVIGLGTRLINQKSVWGIDSQLDIVHIDINPAALGNVAPASVGVHADLADALPLLLDSLPGQPDRLPWRTRIAEVKKDTSLEMTEKLSPQLGWLNAIRAALPEDGLFVDELTQIGFVSRFAFASYRPRTFLSTGYQGTLGWGIATAIGAAHARRDVPVVSIAGDGGALFTITELATAVHHNIPVNIIVMNDNAYGNVRGIQRDNFEGRYIASNLTSPDFVALAKSFGVTAAIAETPQELEYELELAIKNDGPNLIEVPVGEFPSPWEYIMLGKVRG